MTARRGTAAPRAASGSAGRPGLALDALAVAVLVAGWAYLLLPGHVLRRAALPSTEIRVDRAGVSSVAVNPGALREAFSRAGLPDPPDLNGSDPVPAGKLLGFARQWIETGSASALGGMAQVYQALDENEAALQCFAAAAQINPGDVRWTYGLGVECQAVGFQEEAIQFLGRAAEMDPAYPTVFARLGALHLERGELDAARRAYERCRELLPGQSLAWVGLGRVALASGDAARAEEYFTAAVARTRNDFLAQRLLGEAYAGGGKPDLAQRQQKLAERLPQYSGWLTFDRRLQEAHELADTQHYLTNQMRVAAGAGDYGSLVRIGLKLLERRPEDYNTLGNVAAACLELGRDKEADAAIRKALKLKPDSARLHLMQAAIAFQRDDYAAAHESLDAAQKLDPADPKVYELRGRTWLLQGHSSEAIEALNQAVALDPGAARLILALAYRSAGRIAEAMRTLEQLLEMDPDNTQARQMLQALGPANSEGGR